MTYALMSKFLCTKILFLVVMTLFVFLSKANIFVDAKVCMYVEVVLCLYFIPCEIANNNNKMMIVSTYEFTL